MEIIGNFPGRKLIKLWLKAGYVHNNVFHKQETGTPQGGIISPLLANIALHGMEEALGVKYDKKGSSIGKRIVIRYADDFVCLCETKEDAEIAQKEINIWLNKRGLQLSQEKTSIVHITKGFDFLGFNIRQYKVKNPKTGYKLLIKPSKESLKDTRKDIREIFLRHIGKPVAVLIKALNRVIRGKANYMNKVVSSAEFSKLDSYLYLRQVRFAKRTHPHKGKKWIKKRYWGKFNLSREDKWVFGDKDTGAYILKFNWTKIERHALIRKRSSPDNPNLKDYWEERSRKRNQLEARRLNKTQQKVAHIQGHKCPVCGESLFNDEPLHLHHIVPKCQGGKDEIRNLVWVHQYCHHKTHYQKK